MGHHRGVADKAELGGSAAEVEPPTEEAQPARPAKVPRLIGRDMLLSMGLVTLVLLGWLFFVRPPTPDAVRTVPWQPVAAAAADTAAYEVLAPPSSWDWRATSARIEPQPDGTIAWRVGFLTPSGDYVALLQRGVFPAQAAASATDWLESETRQGETEGTVEIAGRTWTRMLGEPVPDERRSLVLRDDGTLTVITGSAPWADLDKLAAVVVPLEAASASPSPAPGW